MHLCARDKVPVSFVGHTWPISFGSGAGLGMAYANCQNDLRSHYVQQRSKKVCLHNQPTELMNCLNLRQYCVYVNLNFYNQFLFSLTGVTAVHHRGTFVFVFLFFLICSFCFVLSVGESPFAVFCSHILLSHFSYPSLVWLYDLYVPDQGQSVFI